MKFLRAFLSVALLSLVLSCAHAPGLKPTPYATKHAIILVLDGPRQSEVWAEKGRPHIPHMDKELLPQGILLAGFRNNGPTYTTSGHTAFCTSHYEDLENSKGSQLPSRPSLFQRYRKASGAPASKTWVITTKDKLAILADTSDPAWHGRWQPKAWCGKDGKGLGSGYGEDPDTEAAALRILAQDHPDLVIINLKQPDAAGHAKDWAGYLKGIRDGDAFAAQLWAFLQSDAVYKDRTALFVTHDHGRHLDGVADGFVSHGDNCEGCRRIALLALGPDFKRGVELPEGGQQVDLAPTIAQLLGFDFDRADGTPLTQLYKEQP
jgi:hypothetical protein